MHYGVMVCHLNGSRRRARLMGCTMTLGCANLNHPNTSLGHMRYMRTSKCVNLNNLHENCWTHKMHEGIETYYHKSLHISIGCIMA